MSLMPQMLGAAGSGGGGGDPGDSAALPVNDFTTVGTGLTAYSGVKFDNDGNVYERQYGGGWSSIGAWLLNGTNSDFYVVRSISSGTLTTDAGAGPLQLNSDRIYDIQATTDQEKITAVDFDIVDSGQTVVYASRLYRLNLIRGNPE